MILLSLVLILSNSTDKIYIYFFFLDLNICSHLKKLLKFVLLKLKQKVKL